METQMKKMNFVMAGIILAGTQLGMSVAWADGEDDVASVTACEDAVPGVNCADYQYPPKVDQEIHQNLEMQLWARVYAPSPLEDGKRYPVLVFQHGRHGSCGDNSYVPRADFVDRYLFTGECDEGHVVVKNHAGYGYIANEMAARGYIVVSVNASRGTQAGTGYEGKSRGRLLLKHLVKLAQWDQGRDPYAPDLGFELQGHVDFNQVGLMGHSRGGMSVRNAYKLAKEDEDIDWTARLGTELTFRGIFEIGPWTISHDVPIGVPMVELLPLCDGQVTDMRGVRVFDRSMSLSSETPRVFRATVAVEGTNHNYFNTEWQHSDTSSRDDSDWCVGQNPLFQADQQRVIAAGMFGWSGWYADGVTGSAEQRELGKQLMTRFFLGTVGADRDPSQADIFDPKNKLPSEIADITNVDRGFSPSSNADDMVVFEEFNGESVYNTPEPPEMFSVKYTALDEHDSEYRGAEITWESASEENVFEPLLTSGVNLQGFDTLDFRVDPTDEPELNLADIDFAIQLVDGNGTASDTVYVSDYVTLSGRERVHSMLQTVRIPLGDFGTQLPFTNIRGVKFTFNDTNSGSIYLASIRATKGGIPSSDQIQIRQDSTGLRTAHRVGDRLDLFASYITPADWAYGPYGQENFQILMKTIRNGYEIDNGYRLNGAVPHNVDAGMAWFGHAEQVEIEQSNSVSNPLRFDAAAGSNYVFVIDHFYNDVAVHVAGDVDGDGDADADDATLVSKEVVGLQVMTRIQSAVADVNCDNSITMVDAQLIVKGDVTGCR
jgi:hypothetical protein